MKHVVCVCRLISDSTQIDVVIAKLHLIIGEVLLIEIEVVIVVVQIHIVMLAKIHILTEIHIMLAQIDVVQIILPKMLIDERSSRSLSNMHLIPMHP